VLETGRLVGEGGEAEVYNFSADKVLKAYKLPDHPQFAGDDPGQRRLRKAAQERLADVQRRLPLFPQHTPQRVCAPSQLAYERRNGGQIVGFTMPLITDALTLKQYAVREYRRRQKITQEEVVAVFRDLHATVEQLHDMDVVIGDFNPLNILVRSQRGHAYVIDADSMQFGGVDSPAFMPRYVDPLLCDPLATSPILVRSHTCESDWYAFAVLFFETLLCVHPYGGVYRPADKKNKVGLDQRCLRRISVFHQDVKYPDAAVPLNSLPDKLSAFFQDMFLRDKRGPFPRELLDNLRFNGEQGYLLAPPVPRKAPAVVAESQAPKPNSLPAGMTSTLMFRLSPPERIHQACWVDSKLRYVYHSRGAYRTEDGQPFLEAAFDKSLRFRIHDFGVKASKGERTFLLQTEELPRLLNLRYVWAPAFERWSHSMSDHLGQLLMRATVVWGSRDYGIRMTQASGALEAEIFSRWQERVAVDLSVIKGDFVDVGFYFSAEHIWMLAQTNKGGRLINWLLCISCDGYVKACHFASATSDWLSGVYEACAFGRGLDPEQPHLLVSSADGIAEVALMNGRLQHHAITGTAGVVGSSDCLLPYHVPSVTEKPDKGDAVARFYFWNPQEIRLLTLGLPWAGS
jgi:serine/threonine protein kinase